MTDVRASRGPAARGSVARVGAATAVAALCGYAVIYLAARDLAPGGYSIFGVFWGAFGMVAGATYGFLQETTREIRSARSATNTKGATGATGATGLAPPGRTHPLRVAALIGVAAAAAMAGSSPWWAGRVFAEERWLSVGLLSVGLAGFCLHATLGGMLAGADQWSGYGALMVTDAVIRVGISAATVAFGWGLAGFLWATVTGSVAWLMVLAASPTARATARLLTPGGTAEFLRGVAHSVTAALASAILVMGFPVLLKLTSSQLGAQGGVIILAVTLTRAPLLVPLTAMQGNLIGHFVDARGEVDARGDRLRRLLAPAGIIGGIGAIGVLAASLVGPWLLRVAFGPQYQASGALLAWLTAAAVAIAMLTLTGAATVAVALHRAYSLGWVGATLASGLLLLLPLSLPNRTVIALLCGPLVGIGVHLVALSRAGQADPR